MNRFDGDGRRRVWARSMDIEPGTFPISVTRAEARRTIARFNERGSSFHSGLGGTIWILKEYCRNNKIPYVIEGRAGEGFNFRKSA